MTKRPEKQEREEHMCSESEVSLKSCFGLFVVMQHDLDFAKNTNFRTVLSVDQDTFSCITWFLEFDIQLYFVISYSMSHFLY